MINLILVLLCVGGAVLTVLFLRLAYRVMRLENCLLKASDSLEQAEYV